MKKFKRSSKSKAALFKVKTIKNKELISTSRVVYKKNDFNTLGGVYREWSWLNKVIFNGMFTGGNNSWYDPLNEYQLLESLNAFLRAIKNPKLKVDIVIMKSILLNRDFEISRNDEYDTPFKEWVLDNIKDYDFSWLEMGYKDLVRNSFKVEVDTDLSDSQSNVFSIRNRDNKFIGWICSTINGGYHILKSDDKSYKGLYKNAEEALKDVHQVFKIIKE